MGHQTTSTLVLAVSLGLGAGALAAQSQIGAPKDVVGCYVLTVEPWSRPVGGDGRYYMVPKIVRLDTLAVEGGGWRLRPNVAYPHGRYLPPPRWLVVRDSIQLVWSNGYQLTVVSLARAARGALRGQAVALSDVGGEPTPRARVTARRAACPSGFAPLAATVRRRSTARRLSASRGHDNGRRQRRCQDAPRAHVRRLRSLHGDPPAPGRTIDSFAAMPSGGRAASNERGLIAQKRDFRGL